MVSKTIVITGTSRGIGFHLASRFLSEGYSVIGISRAQTDISHPEFKHISADLSELDQVSLVLDKIGNTEVAGLINNAGIHGPIGPLENQSDREWIDTFNLNLFSAYSLTKGCIASLRKNNGFVKFFSGGGAAFPRANFSAYGVSKGAVIRLADTLAVELFPEVFVYCIAPGPNRTSLLEEAMDNGESVLVDDFVEFEMPENLCLFLANNNDIRYSGKFIHVKDDYRNWTDKYLDQDAFTLRRLDPRTLSKISFP